MNVVERKFGECKEKANLTKANPNNIKHEEIEEI